MASFTSVAGLASKVAAKQVAAPAKKNKRRKEVKKEPKKDLTPQVVVKQLADNTYTGIIREGLLGSMCLESSAGKYSWNSGTVYEGSFVSSDIEGRGKFLWTDGSSYEGELQSGKRHGEGVFMAADGITRYTGQWNLGKRDGTGRLTYDKLGNAFYDGGWKDGRKHGYGKQVWLSGNSYEGQWEYGKMRGQGTMRWKTGGLLGGSGEQYMGHWDDNVPHGEGTHTWHAAELVEKPDVRPVKQLQPGQQLNNRYEGQWHRGRRHGIGTFYFANGGYYTGEWRDNKKEGQGRYTFENGRVYSGPFEDDQMTDRLLAESLASGGGSGPVAEDNPVCKCTDIADLQAIAQPSDHIGFELMMGTGYTESGKILGEVYNMLLRYLGELREIYTRYRALLPMPGEDPFVVSAYQCWLFARDAGILTPSCTLARVDRCLSSGPRHHEEAAPEDMPEVRPLTPRAELDREFCGSELGDPNPAALGDPTPEQVTSQGGSEDASSGASSPSNGGAGVGVALDTSDPRRSGLMDFAPETPPAVLDDEALGLGEMSELDGALPGRETKFQRGWTSRSLQNIHSPTKHMFFRHFLEGIVRLSLMRFPDERSLESQVKRIFKERVLPMSNTPTSCPPEDIFGFLVNQEFQPTLKEFKPALLQVFRLMAIGEDTAGSSREAHDPSRPGTGTDGCVASRMSCFGNFGAPVRRLHVQARLDVTIRVKDVLKLLDRAGLLRPIMVKSYPTDDPYADLFVNVDCESEGDEESNSGEENGSGGTHDELDSFDDNPKNNFGGLGAFMPKTSVLHGAIEAQDLMAASMNKEKPKAASKKLPEDFPEEFCTCNFTISLLKVLRFASDMLSPLCASALRWRLDPANFRLGDDSVSLLEYVETEMVFAEFMRLLVLIADATTSKDTSLCERLTLPQRFQAFLKHVFLPALRTPYMPPGMANDQDFSASADPEAESEEGEFGEAEDVPDVAAADEGEGGEGEEAEAGEAEAEVPEATTIELWHGFDDGRPRAGFARTSRAWPKGYEQDVSLW